MGANNRCPLGMRPKFCLGAVEKKKSSRSVLGIESRLPKSLHWPSYHRAPAIKTYLYLKCIQWVRFVIPIFRGVRNIGKSDYYLHVRLSWGVKQLRSNCAEFHETWYLSIFRISVEKIRVSLQPDKNIGYFTWRPTYVHLWSYLAEFCLEWEVFQTKVVQKIKTHVFCSVTVFWKSCRLRDNSEKCGRARQATDYNTAHAHFVLDT
jgi:hypothetical protein